MAGTYELTETEARNRELLRWDFPLLAENCLVIVNKRGQRQFLTLKPEQRRFWDAIREQRDANLPVRAIVLKARQLGFSTAIQGMAIQRATQFSDHHALTLAQEHGTAGELFGIGRRMWEFLPDEADLKPKLVGRRKDRRLEFDNDSWYRADSAKEFESGRGLTIHTLHVSEVAFYPDAQRKLTGLLQAVPNEPGTFIALESTANGQNYFKDLWDAASAGESDYIPFFSPWFEEPTYVRVFANESEREDFQASLNEGTIGEDEPDLVSLGCSLEQLHWRRWVIRNNFAGDLDRFRQEFPSCLTAETRVSTERGIIPISEAYDCKTTESGPIERWGEQPASQIYKLTTKGGRVLRGTVDHPVQTHDGLVWLSKLQPGQQVHLRAPCFAQEQYVKTWPGYLNEFSQITVDESLGRFIGYFMGDGSWYKGTVSVACDARDTDVVTDVRRLVEYFVDPPHLRGIARVKGRKGCTEVRVCRKEAREGFERLELIHRVGEKGSWKRRVHVPECILRSPRPVVREFLRGLFEADGSASQNKVRWASSKQDFARDVQLLLLGFGINAPITENRKIAGGGQEYVSYTLDLNVADSKRFYDEIGFVSARKSALCPKEQTSGRPSYPRPLIDEVLSVEEDGFEETWDFALGTEDHLFQAEGIVTHNTPLEAFMTTGRHVFNVGDVRRVQMQVKALPEPETGTLQVVGKMEERRSRGVTVHIPKTVEWVPGPVNDDRHPGWKIWEHPVPKTDDAPAGQYVGGVDASGDDLKEGATAYHVISICDHRTRAQVAEYRSRIDPDELAFEIYKACLYYNRPWMAIEVTGSWGGPAARRLARDFRYPFVYKRQRLSSSSEKWEDSLGWHTGFGEKKLLIAELREMLRTDEHGIRSRGLAEELGWYVLDDRNRMKPEFGKTGDRIIARGISVSVAREKPLRPERKRGDVSSTIDGMRLGRGGYRV